MPRKAIWIAASVLAALVFSGCDAGPEAGGAVNSGPVDPYAPAASRPLVKPGASGGSTAPAATAAALTRVEAKLDETLKLLYDLSVASDRRFAALEGRLAAQTALLEKSGPAPVAPVEPATTAAPAPERRPAPEWTAEQKQWIAKYTARFEGAKPIAPHPANEAETELIGSKLPVTRYLSVAGGAFELNDYVKNKQKVVLVILRGFSGMICLYCSSQTLALSRAEAEFKKRNAQVVLIYPGDADTVPMFLEAVNNLDPKTKVPFPIGMDVNLAAIHQFRIRGELAKPTTIIVDETGVVRYAYVGLDATDRPTVKELLGELDKLEKK